MTGSPLRDRDTGTRRLFIMDDTPEVADLIADVGREIGCEVDTGRSAAELERALTEFEPDLIVLDLVMPGTDGVEVLRYLAEQSSRVGILLASASDERVLGVAERLGRELDLEIVGKLQKPLDVAELRSMLCGALGIRPRITPAELGEAIRERRIVGFFQPKFSVASREVVGSEVLARWIHPEHGQLGPADFIPLAESSGLIQDLTWRVLDEALDQVERQRKAGLDLQVSINLSPVSLGETSLPDEFHRRVALRGVDPASVIVELTESAAIREFTRTADILTRFRLKGFGLSMDDMGTGYSSLVHLVQLPFTELKIDRAFVKELEESRDAQVIVRLTAAMARELQMKVCAEGVESEAAERYLEECSVDTYQGFIRGVPQPAGEWMEFVRVWNARR